MVTYYIINRDKIPQLVWKINVADVVPLMLVQYNVFYVKPGMLCRLFK